MAMSRVRGFTAPTIRSGSGSTTTTLARDMCSGPMSPKCSSVVVITSSLGSSPSPASTTLQPSVVDAVRATDSAETPTSVATSARSASRSSMSLVNCAIEPRPFVRPSASAARIASIVPRASGPTLPACRYAYRSSTGN